MPFAGVALTGIRVRLRSAWSHLAAPERLSLPVLTAGEQTRLSWARVVESSDQLPAAFREPFSALFPGAAQHLPYTVLTPPREGFLNRLNPKLIAIQGDTIYLLERTGNRVDTTCCALGGITYLEVGKILLKSWITLPKTRRSWNASWPHCATSSRPEAGCHGRVSVHVCLPTCLCGGSAICPVLTTHGESPILPLKTIP
jgi:hypothetical protein